MRSFQQDSAVVVIALRKRPAFTDGSDPTFPMLLCAGPCTCRNPASGAVRTSLFAPAVLMRMTWA